MSTGFHDLNFNTDNHPVTGSDDYADIAARDADTSFNTTSANVDKVVRVEDADGSGNVGYFILVSIAPTWSEFTSTTTDEWTELSDTPGSISANLNVQGNSGGTALEFGQNLTTTGSPTFAGLTVNSENAVTTTDVLDDLTMLIGNAANSIKAADASGTTANISVNSAFDEILITAAVDGDASYKLLDSSSALKYEAFYEDDNDTVILFAGAEFSISGTADVTLAAQTTLDLVSTTGLMSFNTQMTLLADGTALTIEAIASGTAVMEFNDPSSVQEMLIGHSDITGRNSLFALSDLDLVVGSGELHIEVSTDLDIDVTDSIDMLAIDGNIAIHSTNGAMTLNATSIALNDNTFISANGTRVIIDALSSGEAIIEFGNSISSQELLVGYNDTLTENFVAAANTLNVQVAAGDLNLSASGDIAFNTDDIIIDNRGNILQSPGDPVLLGSLTDSTNFDAPIGVYVVGSYAYIAGVVSDSLAIVDVSDPTAPVLVGSVSDATNLNGVREVTVAGKFAYLVGNAGTLLSIVDVSDPSNPTITGTLIDGTNFNGAFGLQVAGQFAYVSASNADTVSVVDISDPTTPVLVGTISSGSTLNAVTRIHLQGKFIYAGSINRLTIIDVSDPTTPTEVGTVFDANLGGLTDVYVSGGFAYVVSDGNDLIGVIDVSDPTTPVVVGTLVDGTNLDRPGRICVAGNFAYIISINSGAIVVDISDPTTPVIVAGLSGLNMQGLHLVGKTLYAVSQSSDTLQIIDVTGIDAPTATIGAIETNVLSVKDNASIYNNLSVGSLNVGVGGIHADGGISNSGGGLNITGDITLTPVTGDAEIIINDSSSTEQLRISHLSGSGFNKIESQIELIIETDTDDLSLISDSGNVGLTSTGGDVTLRSINGDVTIRSTNGTIAFNTNALFVAVNDFVGVGTTLPAVPFDVVENSADTDAIFGLETTGTNGGRAETFVGDRDPNENVTGAGSDRYLRAEADLSATYESKEATSGTEWFRRNVYPNKDFEINTQAEYDDLFSDGVIDLFTLGGTLSGYTDGEDITISGGDGSGAEATAVITGGTIQSIIFTERGSGYTFSNVLTITGDTSSTATAIITVDSDEDNVRAITVGTTLFPNLQVSGAGRFIFYEGFDLTINGRNVSEAGLTYSGTDIWFSGTGQLQCFDAVDLKSSSTGTFINLTGTMKVTNLVFRDWDLMGTVRGSFLFREIDMVNCVDGWTLDNPFSTLFQGAASFGNTFNGTLITFKNLNRAGSNFSFSDYRSNIFSATGTFVNIVPTSFKNNSVKVININIPTGNLYKVTTVSNATINSVADSAIATGTLTAMADNGSGGTTISSTAVYFDSEELTITGTTSYNGTFFIFNVVTGVSFDIAVSFVADDATGSSDSVRLALTLAGGHGIVAQDSLKIIETNFYNGFVITLDLPSANVVIINGGFVSTNTGAIEIDVGLDQSDSRVNGRDDFGFSDSVNIACAHVNDNSTANGAIVNNTFTDIVFGVAGTALIASSTMELWRLTDEINGTFEYIGLDTFDGLITFDFTVESSGGTVDFRFKWVIDRGAGFVDLDDDVESLVAVGSDAQSVTKTFPLSINQGNRIKPQITRNSGGSGITTVYATIYAQG